MTADVDGTLKLANHVLAATSQFVLYCTTRIERTCALKCWIILRLFTYHFREKLGSSSGHLL